MPKHNREGMIYFQRFVNRDRGLHIVTFLNQKRKNVQKKSTRFCVIPAVHLAPMFRLLVFSDLFPVLQPGSCS